MFALFVGVHPMHYTTNFVTLKDVGPSTKIRQQMILQQPSASKWSGDSF